MNIKIDVKAMLSELRRKGVKVTQADFADFIGMNPKQLSMILNIEEWKGLSKLDEKIEQFKKEKLGE